MLDEAVLLTYDLTVTQDTRRLRKDRRITRYGVYNQNEKATFTVAEVVAGAGFEPATFGL